CFYKAISRAYIIKTYNSNVSIIITVLRITLMVAKVVLEMTLPVLQSILIITGEIEMDSTQIFLRGVWTCIPDEENTDWVEHIANLPVTNSSVNDYGTIIREMLDKGVSEQTIARFAKIVGYETAFGICYHLGDPNASYEGFPEEEKRIAWGLTTFDDETEEELAMENQITCPHEQLMSMDPCGRWMRPPT
ncbi:hypothetical protein N9383_06585, partial [Granulosicoccus sp.]|nr:hypothetical protein [Granulosicoccus sp.]